MPVAFIAFLNVKSGNVEIAMVFIAFVTVPKWYNNVVWRKWYGESGTTKVV